MEDNPRVRFVQSRYKTAKTTPGAKENIGVKKTTKPATTIVPAKTTAPLMVHNTNVEKRQIKKPEVKPVSIQAKVNPDDFLILKAKLAQILYKKQRVNNSFGEVESQKQVDWF